MDRRKAVAERIKTMRLSRGMSQSDLAHAMRCGQSTIAMYETGKRTPDMETIDFLADVFNVPPYAITYSESEINDYISAYHEQTLSEEERQLLAAYRAADDRARADAMRTLKEHPKKGVKT